MSRHDDFLAAVLQSPEDDDLRLVYADWLSEKNGKKVRLPTSVEWEYAARVGTSNPGFAEKYKDQNSSGPDGFESTLKVKSRKPDAWGLYDLASCWWEITGDKATYHVRKSVVDPHYPPGEENARNQRTGRGIVSDKWSIGTHEFITEKADYAGQKFRVLVEIEANDAKYYPGTEENHVGRASQPVWTGWEARPTSASFLPP